MAPVQCLQRTGDSCRPRRTRTRGTSSCARERAGISKRRCVEEGSRASRGRFWSLKSRAAGNSFTFPSLDCLARARACRGRAVDAHFAATTPFAYVRLPLLRRQPSLHRGQQPLLHHLHGGLGGTAVRRAVYGDSSALDLGRKDDALRSARLRPAIRLVEGAPPPLLAAARTAARGVCVGATRCRKKEKAHERTGA